MHNEYRVFISSTSDLVEERIEAIQAVLASNCVPVSMENWAATSDRPQDRILEKLATCDFFLLLVGRHRGGMLRDTGQSYVEMEYMQATELGLRRVVLVEHISAADEGQLDDAQRDFRERMSQENTTQLWRKPSDVSRLVMGSFLELIVSDKAADCFDTNARLVTHIDRYLERTCKRKDRRKAHIIQYTAANALELVRQLIWAGIKTDLYLISPESEYIISRYQRDKLRTALGEVKNRLRRHGKGFDETLLHIYGYNAPGSLRAVMIDRIDGADQVEHELLAIGTYAYMNVEVPPDMKPTLDIRGGELPGLVLRPRHCGFNVLTQMIVGTLENWHEYRICTEILLADSKRASAAQ